ncbi:MAG: 5'-deoxynucleotidase [Clostridia bacterium]|jgi:5'-deoxynucleotidase|nr:5'-deoxynucleotidase [Clostridia bacterium]
MSKFFAYLNRMKYIKRWSLMRSIREENIMEHSQQVAVIAHALALINNKVFGGNVDANKVVLLAQYHEVGEVITGDLPTPIKYFNPEIKTAYKDLEKNACERIVGMLPEEFQDEYAKLIMPDENSLEYKLVKCADRLSAYLKCVEEVKAGNSEFKKAKTTIGNELKKCGVKEVDYYLKEFAPAFDLTLDELD